MIILVDKPSGFTSYGIVNKIKRLFSPAKVGHSGTLDPLATGLLIIGVGKDTKKLGEILGMEKEYTAKIDFSIITDTWDIDYWNDKEEFEVIKNSGRTGILKNSDFVKAPTIQDIKSKLQQLIPEFELPVPVFSAKKISGKKMYEIARKGNDLELSEIKKKQIMKILEFNIIEYEFPILKIKIKVGSGTYIRSIGHWLGNEFGIGGTIISLRRNSIGKYILNETI